MAQNTKSYISNSSQDTKQIAVEFAKSLKPNDVVVLNGDLGAGKTQFVQGVAIELGITDDVVSPTFNILLEYTSGKIPLFHFDLYRLTDENELEDVAFYDMLESGGLTFIEWGNKFPGCMPQDAIVVEIFDLGNDKRKIDISLK